MISNLMYGIRQALGFRLYCYDWLVKLGARDPKDRCQWVWRPENKKGTYVMVFNPQRSYLYAGYGAKIAHDFKDV